jgi:hypothetical protein
MLREPLRPGHAQSMASGYEHLIMSRPRLTTTGH